MARMSQGDQAVKYDEVSLKALVLEWVKAKHDFSSNPSHKLSRPLLSNSPEDVKAREESKRFFGTWKLIKEAPDHYIGNKKDPIYRAVARYAKASKATAQNTKIMMRDDATEKEVQDCAIRMEISEAAEQSLVVLVTGKRGRTIDDVLKENFPNIGKRKRYLRLR